MPGTTTCLEDSCRHACNPRRCRCSKWGWSDPPWGRSPNPAGTPRTRCECKIGCCFACCCTRGCSDRSSRSERRWDRRLGHSLGSPACRGTQHRHGSAARNWVGGRRSRFDFGSTCRTGPLGRRSGCSGLARESRQSRQSRQLGAARGRAPPRQNWPSRPRPDRLRPNRLRPNRLPCCLQRRPGPAGRRSRGRSPARESRQNSPQTARRRAGAPVSRRQAVRSSHLSIPRLLKYSRGAACSIRSPVLSSLRCLVVHARCLSPSCASSQLPRRRRGVLERGHRATRS